MGEVEEKRRSLWQGRKVKLLVAIVVVVVLVWFSVPYIEELFKYERLDLYDYWWTINSEGNISQVTLHLRNNGTKKLKITKVFINQTEVNPPDWGTRWPRLSPRTGATVYVAPGFMVFEEEAAYNITVGTEAGNFFSYVISVEDGDGLGPEECNIKGGGFLDLRYWGGPIFAWVGFENHGSFSVAVVEGWINGTPYDIRRVWKAPGEFAFSRVWVRPGAVGPSARAIDFYFVYTEGVTYNFTLRTSCGNVYTRIATAD